MTFFQPLMREAYEKNPNMSEAEAKALLERCMKILFYRDARSFNKVSSEQMNLVYFSLFTIVSDDQAR